MWRSIILVLFLAAALARMPAAADSPPECPHRDGAAPDTIEVVFVLDVTGSMAGMIEDAKATIWSIANEVVDLAGGARLRVGVVFYRDRGDDFVTQRVELTEDLDLVYSRLLGMKAIGGGDIPESVNQALAEAVHDTRWTSGPAVRRIVFLVGDAPPHEYRGEEASRSATCDAARAGSIAINTIQYGSDGAVTRVWSEIAYRTQGTPLRIARATSAVERSTAADAQLLAHSRLLDATVLPYGGGAGSEEAEARRERAEVIERDSSRAALADRAAYKAGKSGRATLGANDLITDIIEGRVTLADLDEDSLPPELAELSPEEREHYVWNLMERRRGLLSEIAYFRGQREAELEKRRTDDGRDFDSAILSALRCQILGER